MDASIKVNHRYNIYALGTCCVEEIGQIQSYTTAVSLFFSTAHPMSSGMMHWSPYERTFNLMYNDALVSLQEDLQLNVG